MKSRSVDILDEATDFETQLNWILFKQEIAHVWAGTEDQWRPGDPMYPKPSAYGWMIPDDMPVEFYRPGMTQVVRPLMQEYDPAANHGSVQEKALIWCRECQVGWESEEPCWSCGRELDTDELELIRRQLEWVDRVTEYKVPEGMQQDTYTNEVMRQMWAHLNNGNQVRIAGGHAITGRRSGRTVRGQRVRQLIIDEAMDTIHTPASEIMRTFNGIALPSDLVMETVIEPPVVNLSIQEVPHQQSVDRYRSDRSQYVEQLRNWRRDEII